MVAARSARKAARAGMAGGAGRGGDKVGRGGGGVRVDLLRVLTNSLNLKLLYEQLIKRTFSGLQ